jgi:3-hydroxybutyryl-CoA dehydratase
VNGRQRTQEGSIGRAAAARSADGLPSVGTRFASRGRTVTEADVIMFASLTGDWHPQHSDAEWAKSSLFGERIAHGLLVVSFALALGGLDQSRVVALRRLRDVVFKRPTRIGDTIRAEVTVDSARMVQPGIALVGLRWLVTNACGESLVRAMVEVLWRADSSTEEREEAAVSAPEEHAGEAPENRALDMPEGVYPF